MEKIKQYFVRLRGGNNFVIIMISFLMLWYGLRWVFNWDFLSSENLNVILSVEASLATSLLLDFSLQQSTADRQLLQEILDEEQETQELQQEIADDLETLTEKDNPR